MDPIQYHSDHAHQYAQDHPLEDKPDAFIDLLDRFIALVGEGRVLDAGCGPGHETQYFHDHGLETVGVDAAKGMIEYAKQHHDGTYRQMDLRDLDFETASFDGVWCNVTMQFFTPDEMERVLTEFDRILRQNGILYVTFKLGEGTVITEDHGREIERHLVPEQRARAMVQDNGYDIIETQRAELKWGLEVLNMFVQKHNRRATS